MIGSTKDVLVKDGRGACVDVGNGLNNCNNNILILIIIAVILCCCTGANSFIEPISGGRCKKRRGTSRGGLNSLLYLLIPILLLRGNNSGKNTNTNIINVDPAVGSADDGYLDL